MAGGREGEGARPAQREARHALSVLEVDTINSRDEQLLTAVADRVKKAHPAVVGVVYVESCCRHEGEEYRCPANQLQN